MTWEWDTGYYWKIECEFASLDARYFSIVANRRVRHKHQMLQELKVIKWDKETWILATRYLAPVCIVANNWNQMKFVVMCQTNRHWNENPYTIDISSIILVSTIILFDFHTWFGEVVKYFTTYLLPLSTSAVPVTCYLLPFWFPSILSFKINLLILISLIVQTVGPASARARLAPANIVEWNGNVCPE